MFNSHKGNIMDQSTFTTIKDIEDNIQVARNSLIVLGITIATQERDTIKLIADHVLSLINDAHSKITELIHENQNQRLQ